MTALDSFGDAMRATLLARRLPAGTEAALQEAIAAAFTAAAIPFEREVRLTDEDRIDFLIAGELGLEVKIDGGLSEVTRQLHRYAQHDRIRGLVLVTTRMRHLSLERALNSKRVDIIHLIGGSF